MRFHSSHSGFTLIELLVVIAIIAILAVVVVLTLNPAELLKQSRDSNRLSDITTLANAINIYGAQQGGSSGYFMGNASSVYVSIPDPTLSGSQTSTCNSLNLPPLPAGYSYQCSSPQSYRNINGSGWIPINFTSVPSDPPLSNLPIDPINTSSTSLYYTYTTKADQYEVTSIFESQKYIPLMANDGGAYDGVYQDGNGLNLTPPFRSYGLIGYWPLEEGSGTVAYDYSGNNNNGQWNGTQAGTSGYYSIGKVGPWAGYFDGTDNFIYTSKPSNLSSSGPFTLAAWAYYDGTKTNWSSIVSSASTLGSTYIGTNNSEWLIGTFGYGAESCTGPAPSVGWHFVVGTRSGITSALYVDGVMVANCTYTITASPAGDPVLGGDASNGQDIWKNSIDDVRIYDRILSVAEIQAIYNVEK